jgi:hypothetical protein
MQCPQCNSDNTQRLSVIYQSGTQHISTTSTSFGGGGGTGFGVGSAVTNTSGTSRSYLAIKAAPPAKKTFKKATMFASFWLLSWFLASTIPFPLFLPLLGIAIFSAYKAIRYNKDEYPGLRQTWLKSWHCNKCGTIYADELPFYSSTKQS